MLRYYVPAAAWIVLILFLCTLPGSELPSISLFDKLHMDKIVHFFLFGGTVILLAYGIYRQRGRANISVLVTITVIAILYGLAIEFIQKYMVANRSFELMDVVADAVGAITGALIFRLVGRRYLH